jgi:hypothetical protein
MLIKVEDKVTIEIKKSDSTVNGPNENEKSHFTISDSNIVTTINTTS